MFENDCGCRKNRNCIGIIIFILSVILTFVIGLLVGALTSIIILLNLGTVIAVIGILILLIILSIIGLICGKKGRHDNCCK